MAKLSLYVASVADGAYGSNMQRSGADVAHELMRASIVAVAKIM